MIVLTLAILFPVWFMVINSLKSSAEFASDPAGLPRSPGFGAFAEAVQGRDIGRLFGNSLYISLISVAGATVFGALAAYAIAKFRFAGRRLVFGSLMPLMVIPPIAVLVPQFALFGAMGLIGNPWAVILIYIGIMLPFTIYLLQAFFAGIPDELIDAARIDGAGPLATFLRVVAPLARPGLITAAMVNFVYAWNELLISLVFLQSDQSRTLVVGLTVFRSRLSLDVPVLMAGLTIATLPVVAAYFLGQRYLVAGLLSGVGK